MATKKTLSTAVAGLALTLVATGATSVAMAAGTSSTPSKQDVAKAEQAVAAKAHTVASIRRELAAANQRAEDSAVAAARAGEAYNGARWRLDQATRNADRAEAASRRATRAVSTMRDAVANDVSNAYESNPSLGALVAVTRSAGIDSMLDSMSTMANTQSALGQRYRDFQAAQSAAAAAQRNAETARAEAAAAAQRAKLARDQAADAQRAALAEAQQIANRKAKLIAELAHLQHVSVKLARQRQAAIEERRREAAERAAEEAARKAAAEAARKAAAERRAAELAAAQQDDGQASDDQDTSAPSASPEASTSEPAPANAAGGVAAAIAFARDQIGEPYVWGAAGPDSWDCSGLTMGAWHAGGKSLPHYSVAQYQSSTPIGLDDLQPGDLVFWGSDSNPDSIFHVALYVGDGRIIQAPRTGVPVEEVSMYEWRTPNFFARP